MKLTKKEKDIIVEALKYYKDELVRPTGKIKGVWGTKRKTITATIDKIVKSEY